MILFRSTIIVLVVLMLPAGITPAQEITSPGNETDKSDHVEASEVNQSILQYLGRITEQERLHGVYDPQLSEQLLGLGLLYKNLGRYEDAAVVLERSLHIKKVNDGIQSMTQVPVLEALIDVNANAGKWDELNKNYHLLLWVHQRNLETGDPTLLPVIERVGRWKLAAYVNGLLSESPATTLNDIINIYESTVDILTNLYGENDTRLIGPLKGLSLVQYQLVNLTLNRPVDEFLSAGRKDRLERVCNIIMLPDGTLANVCTNVAVPDPQYYVEKQNKKDMTVARHMTSVRDTLNRIVDISTVNQISPYERAVSLVNLGDWYFINNKRRTALDYYRSAYRILEENEYEPKYFEALLGKPVRIPFMSTASPDPDGEIKQELQKPYVRLAFDVATDGKARRIKVIEESDPDNFKVRKIARRQISNSLFRPRFQGGEPVATEQVEILLYGTALDRDSMQNARASESRFDSITGARIRR